MTCQICDNKPANCDCTVRERELFAENTRLREALEQAYEYMSDSDVREIRAIADGTVKP